ncbi:MAG: hypothetical protein EBT18_12665, partial [Gammaproteobacteria bacterium]|nr:hypothetical protein [Gammaproteobacteria bacterium]
MKFNDFSRIDIQEELAWIEGTEFVSWSDVAKAREHRRANPIPSIKTPWQKLHGRFEFSVGGY